MSKLELEPGLQFSSGSAEGQLCGHIAKEDAEKIGRILENGLRMNTRVPTGAKRRGGKMGKEMSLDIFY